MLIFWSETRGNTAEKAKGSVWLRKQETDVLQLQSRATASFNVAIRPKFQT